MTTGLLGYLPIVMTVIGETGVTFDQALDIVHTAHLPPPESNVIAIADFVKRNPHYSPREFRGAKDEDGLA